MRIMSLLKEKMLEMRLVEDSIIDIMEFIQENLAKNT